MGNNNNDRQLVRRTEKGPQPARPVNKCTLRRFSSPYDFHRRYGYGSGYRESPTARALAEDVVLDASDAWQTFVDEITGETDLDRLLQSVRRLLARLSRLEAGFGEAAAGTTFETYSQVRAAFVMARMQLDELLDEVFDSQGSLVAAPPPVRNMSAHRTAPAASSRGPAGTRQAPSARTVSHRPVAGNDAAHQQGTAERSATHPDLIAQPRAERTAYRLGLVVGGVAGAAVIFSALVGR